MKEDPFNIFDEAARRSSGTKKKATLSPKAPVEKKEVKPPVKETGAAPSREQVLAGDTVFYKRPSNIQLEPLSDEFREQLAIAKRHHDEIVDRLDEIQKKMGMSLTDMKEYLSNPRNFKPYEWELIQKRRAAIEERIFNLIGAEGKKMVQKGERDKMAKDRKGKSLGARKKWIPIR